MAKQQVSLPLECVSVCHQQPKKPHPYEDHYSNLPPQRHQPAANLRMLQRASWEHHAVLDTIGRAAIPALQKGQEGHRHPSPQTKNQSHLSNLKAGWFGSCRV